MPPKLNSREVEALERAIAFSREHGGMTITAKDGRWGVAFGNEAAMTSNTLGDAIRRAQLKTLMSEQLQAMDVNSIAVEAIERGLRFKNMETAVREAGR